MLGLLLLLRRLLLLLAMRRVLGPLLLLLEVRRQLRHLMSRLGHLLLRRWSGGLLLQQRLRVLHFGDP